MPFADRSIVKIPKIAERATDLVKHSIKTVPSAPFQAVGYRRESPIFVLGRYRSKCPS